MLVTPTGCTSVTCRSSPSTSKGISMLTNLPCSCGMQCIANLRAAKFECRLCNNKTEISQIFIPYAAKLLFQEVSPGFSVVGLRSFSG